MTDAAILDTGVVEAPRSVEYLAGYSDGYRAAMCVLDEAGAFLSTTLRPAEAIDLACVRARAGTRTGPDLTGQQLRAHAYASWDLPLPADLAEHATDTHNHASARVDVIEEGP